MSLDDVAIVPVEGHDYTINFWSMSKAQTVNRMNNADLSEKS